VRILITGARGFIGRHLAQALIEDGHQLVFLDCKAPPHDQTFAAGIDLGEVSIDNDLTHLMPAIGKVDACVHLAAVASPPVFDRNPAQGWATNVQGTYNVLCLMQAARIPRMVFFSSAHVYGINPKWMPTPEHHPLALHDRYTVSKIMGEHLCHLFYENAGISYACLRVFNAYGSGQTRDYFLANKIAQAREGRLTVRNGGTTKDWIHVSDVVEATKRVLVSDYVGPLNIGTGIETSLKTIVEQISTHLDVEVTVEHSTGADTQMCCDSTRARQLLSWEPKVRFQDGLRNLLL